MRDNYIIGIDQSTSGTKALLFDKEGRLIERKDIPHKQIINELGWVEHNPVEIYENTLSVVKEVIEKSGISKNELAAIGISNQRETAMVWDRKKGKPLYNAIVWQCARGEAICNRIAAEGYAEIIKDKTGLHLSPYFSAAKISWILENIKEAKEKAEKKELCCGTMDSWLLYKLTEGTSFKTDYSNASRTQIFNINTLAWDEDICDLFGIPLESLARVCDSNACFGETDFEGFLDKKIPIHGILGDSHGALFGQGCLEKGMIKATYGTGSSVMMNIGESPVFSKKGVVTSLAWGMDGKVSYVLEGNINYTGAVIQWLKDDLKMISSAGETEQLAESSNPLDRTYLVPAFTGLGAPYWDSKATGIISGITRTTGQAEIVRAALDCIGYQISDVIKAMSEDAETAPTELRVDGGPTRNRYLMQFQSNILDIPIQIPDAPELSGIGAAYAAGIGIGLYHKETIFQGIRRTTFLPGMRGKERDKKYSGWKKAVKAVLSK